MALFFECVLQCAQKVLDAADIVRDGDFYRAWSIDPGDYFSWLAVGDFDGDGKVDLAIGMLDAHAVCIFFNAGQVQFTRDAEAQKLYEKCGATLKARSSLAGIDCSRDPNWQHRLFSVTRT